MAKFFLVFFLVYLNSVEGQRCDQLPSQSAISSDLAAAAGLSSVELTEGFHNCIVYGEATGRAFTQTTITGRFNAGSRMGQIMYTCVGSAWIPSDVTLDVGVTQNVMVGCSNCSFGTTLADTCTGAL